MTVDMENAAFNESRLELSMILEKVSDAYYSGAHQGNIRDSNGNTVGGWKVEDSEQ